MKKLLFFLLLFPVALFGQEIINLDGGGGGASASGGGGGALTGVATYSNASGDFAVETIDGTKSVYVTGAPYTIIEAHVVAGSGKVWNTSTNAVSILSIAQVSVSGDTITFGGQSSNFVATDSVSLFLIMPTKAYDIPQDVEKTSVRNPDYAHYTDMEQIIDETNLDTDSAYAVFYMASYQYYFLHVNVSGGVTVTVYGSGNLAASDTDETSDWVDYSSVILGAASITDVEGLYIQDTPAMLLKFLVKVVTSDASNAADIFLRRWY